MLLLQQEPFLLQAALMMLLWEVLAHVSGAERGRSLIDGITPFDCMQPQRRKLAVLRKSATFTLSTPDVPGKHFLKFKISVDFDK